MRQLVAKWVDAENLPQVKKIERPLEIVPEKNSEEEMEQKLKDLLSMKEERLFQMKNIKR